jgi:hypothetical protein
VIRSTATSFVVASSLWYEEVVTPPPLAKCVCGEADRLDSACVFEPRSGPQSADLRRLLKCYFAYYPWSRTHLALAKDASEPRAIMRQGEIIAIAQVGGLHHRYERSAA